MIRKDHKRRSRIQERRTAQEYGGKTTPGSGNQWFAKADVRSDLYLIECKTTTKQSYTLKYDTLKTLWDQALIEGKYPILTVEFAENKKSVVLLDADDFRQMRYVLEGE